MGEKILNYCITVTHGMSGWFAICAVEVEDDEIGRYWDVQQSGIGRYATREEALREAKQWSIDEEVKLCNE